MVSTSGPGPSRRWSAVSARLRRVIHVKKWLKVGGAGVAVALALTACAESDRDAAQDPDAWTHLLSPAMAAAAAVTGRLTDVRALDRG